MLPAFQGPHRPTPPLMLTREEGQAPGGPLARQQGEGVSRGRRRASWGGAASVQSFTGGSEGHFLLGLGLCPAVLMWTYSCPWKLPAECWPGATGGATLVPGTRPAHSSLVVQSGLNLSLFPKWLLSQAWEMNISNVKCEMIMRSVGSAHSVLNAGTLGPVTRPLGPFGEGAGAAGTWPSHWPHLSRAPEPSLLLPFSSYPPNPNSGFLWPGQGTGPGRKYGHLNLICYVLFFL